MIKLDHVSFAYPEQGPSVDDVSFRVEDGEFVAILGANGAGKTTTVRLIDGLIRPTAGTVEISVSPATKSLSPSAAASVSALHWRPSWRWSRRS